MFRRGFWIWRVLAGLVLIGGLVIAGVMLFQAGHAQGYAQGIGMSGEQIQPAMPPAHFFPGFYHRPHLLFFPFGWVLGMLFWGFLIFAFAGFLFWRRFWHHAGPHMHVGYPPPWWGKPQSSEEGQSKDPGQPPAPQP